MMKFKYFGFLIAGIAIALQSCDNLEEISTPYFQAFVDKEVYTAGDTVRISFKGDVDYITLFTGKSGNDYDFKEKTRLLQIPYYVDFTTHARDGNQTNQMSILVSKNFDGDYSFAGAKRATWNDVTSKFIMAPAGYRDYLASGLGNVSDAIFEGDEDTSHVYFAIRQIVKDQTTIIGYDAANKPILNTGNLNRVQNFRIRTQADINSEFKDFYPYASFGFGPTIISSSNKQTGRAGFEGTNIIMMRNNTGSGSSLETEDWVISKKMMFPRAIDVGRDWGLPIKSINDRRLDYYQVAYNEPGDYQIVVFGFNANANGKKEVEKRINIKVLPK